ncbi:MAG: tripartite tricarboxylate transporter TctB family protein [Alphaproteobacteria bacterium]|nr:tripartite tricarboxylate transporter TctB family protein [Alphaproteobacteria bacterium]
MRAVDPRRSDAFIGLGLLALCGFMAWQTSLIRSVGSGGAAGPTLVPWIMIAGTALLSLLMIVRALRRPAGPEENAPMMPSWGTLGRMTLFFLMLIGYAVAFSTLGYLGSTLIVFVAGLWLFGERRLLVLALVPLVVTGAVYLGFTRLLNVWLP